MSKVYFSLIKKELRTIKEVPEKYKAEVEKLLQEG